MKRFLPLFLFVILLSSVASASVLHNRTMFSNEYTEGSNSTRTKVFYFSPVNMINISSGEYVPYVDLNNLSYTSVYSMNLSWPNYSLGFQFYVKNLTGSKIYISDMSEPQKSLLNFLPSYSEEIGYFSYNFTMDESFGISAFGMDLLSVNHTCYISGNVSLVCGDHFLDFYQANYTQNFSVSLTNYSVEFTDGNFTFIDPTVTQNVSLSNLGEIRKRTSNGAYCHTAGGIGTSGTALIGNATSSRSGCFGGALVDLLSRGYYRFSISSLSDLNLTTVTSMTLSGDYFLYTGSETLYWKEIANYDAGEASSGFWDDVCDGDTYSSVSVPDGSGYSSFSYSMNSLARTNFKDDVNNDASYFLIGACVATESTSSFRTQLLDDFYPTNLSVTYYYLDVDPPVTNVTATSCGEPYSFGDTAECEIQISMSCDDGDGDGCDATYYCIDRDNTCTPTITYTGTIANPLSDTSYVRYYSVDVVSNEETLTSQIMILGSGGGAPPIGDVLDELFEGNSLWDFLYAWNPEAYFLLSQRLQEMFNNKNLADLPNKVYQVTILLIKYIFRQPASLVPGGGV